MNLRTGVIAVVLLAIVAMLAMVWPVRRRAGAVPGLKKIEENVRLAEDLKRMQNSADENLDASRWVARRFEEMRRPLPLSASSPFATAASLHPAPHNPSPKESPPSKDPEPPVTVNLPPLSLGGTAVAGRDSLALINDEVFRLGDVISGLKLVRIGEDAVELVSADGRIRKTLALEGWAQEERPK